MNTGRATLLCAAMAVSAGAGYEASERVFETPEQRNARVEACAQGLPDVLPAAGVILYEVPEGCERFRGSFIAPLTQRLDLQEQAGPDAARSDMKMITAGELRADQKQQTERWARLRSLTGLAGGVMGSVFGLVGGMVVLDISDREQREREFFENLKVTVPSTTD